MPRIIPSLVLAAAALVTARAEAQVPGAPLAESSFVSGAEGWLSITLPYPSALPPTILGTYSPTWVSSLGGYIKLNDPDGSGQTGNAQYWVAPAAYLGDRSAAYGGSLELDLANSSTYPAFTQEDVLLIGGGLTLVHALGGAPVPAFTHFSIPMSETGWTVGAIAGPPASAQQMQCVLSAVEHLYIRAEYLNGPDTEFLDNVSLLTGPTASGPWTTLGFGLGGVTGIPCLLGTGTLAAGSSGNLALLNARPSSLAVLFLSLASTPTPFKGGVLATVPVTAMFTLGTDASGALTLPWIWPAGIPSATTLYFQFAIQDIAGPHGVSLSNAVKAVTP